MLLGEEYWLIVRIIRDTFIQFVGKTQSFLMLQHMVNTASTVISVTHLIFRNTALKTWVGLHL